MLELMAAVAAKRRQDLNRHPFVNEDPHSGSLGHLPREILSVLDGLGIDGRVHLDDLARGQAFLGQTGDDVERYASACDDRVPGKNMRVER